MDFIISLAHFCEVHGPTSVLCTQLAPIKCATCFPCTTPPSEDITKGPSVANSGFWESSSASLGSGIYSPYTSPPTSPQSANFNPYFSNFPNEKDGMRKGMRADADSDCDACDNCNFLIPKNMREKLPNGAPGSPTKDGRGQHGSPILRTTQSVLARGNPPRYDDDDDDDDDEDDNDDCGEEDDSPTGSYLQQSSELGTSPTPSQESGMASSTSSPFYRLPKTHTHSLTYLTTRQPSSPATYSLLRRSCIRTLSCENLPRGSPSGSLLFGDSIAGYTIAYVFRLPDPRARGRRRTYALIALGPRDSWRATGAYVAVTRIFESIAGKIISMADSVLERESSSLASSAISSSRPSTADMLKSPPSTLSSSLPEVTAADPADSPPPRRPKPERSRSSTSSPTPSNRTISDVSSFLTAKKVDPGGYPRMSREVMRAKGLAEIVGKDNFFVQLHVQFCRILAKMV